MILAVYRIQVTMFMQYKLWRLFVIQHQCQQYSDSKHVSVMSSPQLWFWCNWPVTFGRHSPAKTDLREDEDPVVVSVQLLHHIQHEDELATRLHQRVTLKHTVGQLWCLLSQHKGHRSTREQALSQVIVTGASYCFMTVLITLNSEAHQNKCLAALKLLTDGWEFRQIAKVDMQGYNGTIQL